MTLRAKLLTILIALLVLVGASKAFAQQAQYTVCRHSQDGHTITVQGYSCPIGYNIVRSFWH